MCRFASMCGIDFDNPILLRAAASSLLLTATPSLPPATDPVPAYRTTRACVCAGMHVHM